MGKKLNNLSIRSNLSLQLLLLTMLFVLLAEILIYVPSIVNFRNTWLEERLAAANIAILAIEEAPDHMVSEELAKRLLDNAQVVAISLKQKDKRQLLLNTDQPLVISARYDIRGASPWEMIIDTIKILFHDHPHGSLIQVTGHASFMKPNDDTFLEIIFREDLLCEDMHDFSINIMLLSIIISLITAGLVYFSLSLLLIRPIKSMTRSVVAFRAAPETTPLITTEDLATARRQDEIGIVMRELGLMQNEIRKALSEKKHLAQLGESVSKINHDLRNILASAQMVSDHLNSIDNPLVQKLTPRFVTAVARAIRLCETTLSYGKADIEIPTLTTVDLERLVSEVIVSLGISDSKEINLITYIPDGFSLNADEDQIFRALLNLCRNALQAIQGAGQGEGQITITAHKDNGKNIIDICDNGSGIPKQIKAKLFQPFHGSSNGGAGLGLAISKEIIEAHDGSLELVNSDKSGSHFRIIMSV